MKVLSPLVAASLLSVIAGNGTNLKGRERNITPYMNNAVDYTPGEGTMLRRQTSIDGSICGRSKLASVAPLNRGENIINNYDYPPDDDTIETPELDKILGGFFANFREVPWQVAILINHLHVCSGTIISEFWVLTAAHCLYRARSQPHWFQVTAGDHRLNYLDAFERDYDVDKMFIHQQYTENPYDYDIALIKIKAGRYGEGFRFNNYVQPVCLANVHETPKTGTQLKASGWGYKFLDIGGSDILKKTILPVIDRGNCETLFPGWANPRTLCVGYMKGHTQLCEGDSGGPATADDGIVSTVLYGFLSYASSCDSLNLPSLLSSVPAYREWIDQTISNNSVGREGIMPVRRFLKPIPELKED